MSVFLCGSLYMRANACASIVLLRLREHWSTSVFRRQFLKKRRALPELVLLLPAIARLTSVGFLGQGARCNIICTQPRRISAIGVADRVADECV